jgi:putative SOS response-associated peptidase YedK
MCGRAKVSYLSINKLNEYKRSKKKDLRSSSGNKLLEDQSHEHSTNDEKLDIGVVQNLSPGMACPVVMKANDHEYRIEKLVWGLIPSYLDANSKPNHYQMFNKRIESFQEKSSTYFDNLLKHKRCILVVDGFYEWKIFAGKKHPHYVHLPLTPMQMPCIYEDCDKDLKTFSVITSEPCAKFASIHNRQPVFLTDDQASLWLQNDLSAHELQELVAELEFNHKNNSLFMNNIIEFYPVTPKMTNPAYQEPDCSSPIKIQQLTSFFKVVKNDGDIESLPSLTTQFDEEKSVDQELKVSELMDMPFQEAVEEGNLDEVIGDVVEDLKKRKFSDESAEETACKRSHNMNNIAEVDLTQKINADGNQFNATVILKSPTKVTTHRMWTSPTSLNKKVNSNRSPIKSKKNPMPVNKNPITKFFQPKPC